MKILSLSNLNLLLGIVFSIFLGFSSEANTSPCAPHGVRSFKIAKFNHFADISSDNELCSDRALLTKYPKLIAIIQNAQATMQKVSETLLIPLNELFPNGIELSAISGTLGSLNEGASGDSVTLYQFDDWNGDGFDVPGFAHELGHVIAVTLPKDRAIHDLRSIPLLREGFPDLVAYATTGETFQRSYDLPQVIEHFANRDLSQKYTYDRTLGFYLETYVYSGLHRICEELPALVLSERHTKDICETARREIIDSSFKKTFAFTDEHFSVDRCLQLWDSGWEGRSCDMHQISLPWTSSLVRLGRKSVLKILELLTQATPISNLNYSCHYSGDSNRSHWIEVTSKSWNDVYKGFYEFLTPQLKHKWDDFFRLSSLQLSAGLDQKWLLKYVFPQRASKIIQQRTSTQNDSVYNSQNQCFNWSADTVGNPPGCVVTCEELNP